jgi:hypothetical protein
MSKLLFSLPCAEISFHGLFKSTLAMLDEADHHGRSSKSNPPSRQRSRANSSDVSYLVADKLEVEIELLMASGYSRDSAVKILLDRARAVEQVIQ